MSSGSILTRLKRLAVPALLGLFCFLVYNANFRRIGAGDTLPARYLPLLLWHQGTFDLDANSRLVSQGHSMIAFRNRPAGAADKVQYFEPPAYWLVRTRDHQLASLYPVVTPLLVTPLYYPAVRWLDEHGWDHPQVARVAELMEKVSASLLASVAVVLMYLLLRREAGGWSLPLALGYAFGTNTWMISSQALWQHGTAQLLITLALLLLVSKVTPLRTILLGVVCALIVANRPPDSLIAGAMMLFVVWTRWRSTLWLVVGAMVPMAALMYYNLFFVGHYAGGYALVKSPHKAFFHLDWLGVPGLLISPGRGLLVFSPFLIFVAWGIRQRWRSPQWRALTVALSLAVVAQLILYSQADWRAGESWGPRFLTDLLPILMWMLAPAPLLLRPLGRVALVLAMTVSVGVQAIGAFSYDKSSDDLVLAGKYGSTAAAWNIRNFPFLTELKHPPASRELLYDASGSIDLVGTTLIRSADQIPVLDQGGLLEGWALTGNRTPAQLFLLIDGIVIGATEEFLPRVDVNEAMNTTARSGWRVFANTYGVAAGERVLQMAVRIDKRSDLRIVREMRVNVSAHKPGIEITNEPLKPASGPELEAMAAQASQALRERQTKEGYWYTMHTKVLRYETPVPEMNTYLTATLFDVLSPVAPQFGLSDAVKHAKQHLAVQIESDGLVRYHGLPDAPTIGTLGCIITPDSDDTALAWRIAGLGAGDARLQSMLKKLAEYRDGRGLYRTWLAPRHEYQNLDPGLNPNPTDIVIQMHIYMMLRQLDPPAAEQLARVLQRLAGEPDIWAYYAKAPLIPYLRMAELQHLGCPLPLPVDRMELPAEGQELWCATVRQLVSCLTAPQDEKSQMAVRDLLTRLGSHDFARVRQQPPLLYHNDLSAKVRRYYWSEDFGYALWLRLYEAANLKNIDRKNPAP